MGVRAPLVLCLLGLVVAPARIAFAQPLDPYAEPTKPTPVVDDAALNEQVAMALVKRAQELYDARVYTDAKQLAVEAVVKSPNGAAAEQAKFLIKSINAQLGIDDTAKPPGVKAPVEAAPLTSKPSPHVDNTPEQPPRTGRLASAVHAGLYVGLLGATVGAFAGENDDGTTSAGSPILIGLVTGGVAAVYLPSQLAKLDWSEGQIRTMGSISVWSGVTGAMFGDIADTDQSNARQVLVGASIGATAGVLAGAALAHRDRYTPGDIALVDTFAGIGTVGGFTLGMLMQPAKTEAYSLNAAFGAAGGAIAGLIAAPETNTTPRRMARVAGLAAAGGALPFLIYAATYDESSDGDERLAGALSSIGLVGGAWLGFRLTAKLDVGLDVKRARRKVDAPSPNAPVTPVPFALVSRDAEGQWALGGLTVQPLSQRLAPQRGMAVPLLGGTF